MNNRLAKVIADIDAINDKDPNLIDDQGRPRPKEKVFSDWLEKWVLALDPEANEFLRVAARGQHVGRWKIPRDNYAKDRGGYLLWREELKRVHAKTVSAIMDRHGYTPDERTRVEHIILKKDLKSNPESQTIEDALCLVFLEHQFSALAKKTSREKMIAILKKTWNKMSEAGRKAAINLDLPQKEKDLLKDALK